MENDENEIQNSDVQKQDEMENTETFSEQESPGSFGDSEGTNSEFEGNTVYSNDNSEPVFYSNTYVLDETQYNNICNNLIILNHLNIVQVMFLFTLFLYLFIHFSMERRKF